MSYANEDFERQVISDGPADKSNVWYCTDCGYWHPVASAMCPDDLDDIQD